MAAHLIIAARGNVRVPMSASKDNSLSLLNHGGEISDPITFEVPEGVSEVILQGRMCGDFYAEATSGHVIKSATGEKAQDALAALFERFAQ